MATVSGEVGRAGRLEKQEMKIARSPFSNQGVIDILHPEGLVKASQVSSDSGSIVPS